jgi:hypothetical protein
MENQLLELLAKRLNLTDETTGEEEYILTPEEEQIAVAHQIKLAKEHKTFRLLELGDTREKIAQKISAIDWEKEISREEILKRANSNKHQDLWHQKQREAEKEKEKNDKEELVKKCTASYMFQLMKWASRNVLGRELIVNENNKKFISALCFFMSNDERFETELGYSLKKGLLIRGISGLGKTHLVRCLEQNELNPILILSMIEITDEIRSEGEYEIKMSDYKKVYLDDVGTEEATVNHFGSKISFFKTFIESVYLRNQARNNFSHLIISTNNNFKEIEEKYGFRVRSRMKDMFNTIDVTGEDMRG